jgi:hypothetical protein
MDDVEAAKSLTERIDRQIDSETITGGEITACLQTAEFTALTQPQRDYVTCVCASASIPNTQAFRSQIKNVFANGTQTDTRIQKLLKRASSRAEELGLGRVTESDIADARRLP